MATGWWAEIITTPTPRSLTITGGTPIVTTPANRLIQPTGALLTLTGGQPAIGGAVIIAPTGVTLTVTGATPTIALSNNKLVTPTGVSLTVTGATPTVTTTANKLITPTGASLTVTGGTPSVLTPRLITPTGASLTTTGGTPTVTVASAVNYDAVGTGANSTSVPASFNFTAATGADVFVAVTVDRTAGNITGATYGGTAMTQIASIAHNNDSTKGITKVFRLAGSGNASAKAVLATGSGTSFWIVNAISFTGITTVGTVVTATGTSTSASQSVSGLGLHVFSDGNAGTGPGAFSSFAGVTNRANITTSGSCQALDTVAASGTASATLSISTPWASIFVPLS
jgi:hypothetical protein